MRTLNTLHAELLQAFSLLLDKVITEDEYNYIKELYLDAYLLVMDNNSFSF